MGFTIDGDNWTQAAKLNELFQAVFVRDSLFAHGDDDWGVVSPGVVATDANFFRDIQLKIIGMCDGFMDPNLDFTANYDTYTWKFDISYLAGQAGMGPFEYLCKEVVGGSLDRGGGDYGFQRSVDGSTFLSNADEFGVHITDGIISSGHCLTGNVGGDKSWVFDNIIACFEALIRGMHFTFDVATYRTANIWGTLDASYEEVLAEAIETFESAFYSQPATHRAAVFGTATWRPDPEEWRITLDSVESQIYTHPLPVKALSYVQMGFFYYLVPVGTFNSNGISIGSPNELNYIAVKEIVPDEPAFVRIYSEKLGDRDRVPAVDQNVTQGWTIAGGPYDAVLIMEIDDSY